jgi:hypothetical protein
VTKMRLFAHILISLMLNNFLFSSMERSNTLGWALRVHSTLSLHKKRIFNAEIAEDIIQLKLDSGGENERTCCGLMPLL